MSLIGFFKTKAFFKHLGLMIGAFIGILIIAFICLNFYTRHNDTYTMPELEGMYLSEIIDIQEMKNFEVIIMDSIYTPGENQGKIISQDPLAGSKVKKGRKIYVVITSKTGENIPMPNCTDQSVRSAVGQLTNVGLRVGRFIFNVGEFNNIVVGQRHRGKPISDGENIQRGEEIDLIVEMNQERYTSIIPNIIGLTEQDAEKKLWEEGLTIGKKTFEGKRDIIHSRVVSFSPNSSSITKGTAINMVLLNDTKSNFNKRMKAFKIAKPSVEETKTNEIIDEY